MSQSQISITTGVTTHEDVLNSMNSNFSDAESRLSSLESATGEHLDFIQSGDNISLFTNDAGYLTDAIQSGDNISLLVNDAGYLTGDAVGGTQFVQSVNPSFYTLVPATGYTYNGTEGNTRGLNAVDLQIRRQAAADIAGGTASTIIGGDSNEISNGGAGVNGQWATIVGGGFNNIILGQYSTILGGYNNQINPDSGNANYSVACGAQANAKHANTFVFNDQQSSAFASVRPQTFNIHAANGLRLVTDGSQTSGQVLICDANGHGDWGDLQGYVTSDEQVPQTISSSSSILTLDSSLGANANTTLTEDVTGFSITNTSSGDSGLIIVKQNNTGAWTFTSTYDVLGGDLVDIASITPSGIGACSIGWYNNGTDNYLYVSNFT